MTSAIYTKQKLVLQIRTRKVDYSALFWLLFLLQLLCISTHGVAMHLNSTTDKAALLAFKAHITSDAHNIMANWSTGTSFCNWIGITCSRLRQRVTSLVLSDKGLGGTIPKEIGHLSFLKILQLRNNSFHGEIPKELGKLRRLRELSMGDNELSGLIPSTIYNISSLWGLSLRYNRLQGTLPVNMCANLGRLNFLYLSHNQLTGVLPPSLPQCSQLFELFLGFNKFHGTIPSQIGNLSQFEWLSLYNNNFTGELPLTLFNISSLRKIDVERNDFSNNIHPSISHCTKLEMLALSFNHFSGELPQAIFNISSLQSIVLGQNNLSGSPFTDIPQWPLNLYELVLHHNRLTGRIPNSISNASILQGLDLGYNFFSGPIPTTLGNLHRLQILSLYDNQLTNDPSTAELDFLTSLTNISSLVVVNFGSNPLNAFLPESLAINGSSLQRMYLLYSGIRGKIPAQIGNFRDMMILDLSGNVLTGSIPETLGYLRNLQGLFLSFNYLKGPIPTTICNLKELSDLRVQGNMLFGSLPDCLGKMSALRHINLASNEFTSSVSPNILSNQDILYLNLSNNNFTSYLSPEIGNLKQVIELDLSVNHFSGQIPSSIEQLRNLINFTLARNKLQGPIPQSFANMISLQSLDLSQNNLSGMIPKSLENLKYLTYLNVSFNELAGEIPIGGPFANFTFESFLGNSALCGAPRYHVKGCKKKPRLSRELKILIYVLLPVVALVITLSIFMIWYLKMKKRSNQQRRSQATFPFDYTRRRISTYEILQATENFDESNLIGQGRFGTVYKGMFPDGLVAAIKVFNSDMQDAFKSFSAECQILSTVRHRNLVKVITSCSNLDFKALVLEFMPNRDLEKWLYSHNHFLDIVQRLEIMIDVASALEYLHQDYSFPIVHCDLKPNNILLDEDMVAHVGDFGISKLLPLEKLVQTKTIGTIGYVAPEYGSEGIVTTMGDAYSFGILLIETFTRKKPTDEMFSGALTMKRWVLESLPRAVMAIVDENLVGRSAESDDYAKQKRCFSSIFELALECSKDMPEERIAMKDVVLRLKKIKTNFRENHKSY